ncbi:MAG: VWA domain-containing protein [Succinivibrionaceae bacterium]
MDSLGIGLGSLWWVFLLLMGLPFLIRYLPGKSKKDEFIFITSLPHYLPKEPKNKENFIFTIAYAAWFFLMLACMGPVYYDKPIVINQPHRDMFLAIDLSDSMETRDMFDKNKHPITRLDVVKSQLKFFIENRIKGEYNDRIGIILFADTAHVLAPLTFDKKALLELVDEIDLSMAGQLTNIAGAIELSQQRFEEAGTNQKILILLSDGRNTVDGMSPVEAANIAKDRGMKIYTIGFGGDSYTRDDTGVTTKFNTSADLDEDTLRQIANITKGSYFRATMSDSLRSKYQEINYLEATEEDPITYQPEAPLYQWPLFFAIILSVCAGIAVRRING